MQHAPVIVPVAGRCWHMATWSLAWRKAVGESAAVAAEAGFLEGSACGSHAERFPQLLEECLPSGSARDLSILRRLTCQA